jgi:hypothetical protein
VHAASSRYSFAIQKRGKFKTWLCVFFCSPKTFGEVYSRRVVHSSVRQSVRTSVRTYVPNSCPAHYFVIWSCILHLFHRNDHHIKTKCCTQHLGRFLEGHSMTLQQNRVRPITSLFKVGLYNYFTEMITILRRRIARNIWVVFLHFELCLWHNSDTTRGITSFGKNLFGEIIRFNGLLVFVLTHCFQMF